MSFRQRITTKDRPLRSNMNFKRWMCALLVFTIMTFSISPNVYAVTTYSASTGQDYASFNYCTYIKNVSYTQRGVDYSVTYTLSGLPKGEKCYIGYEAYGGARQQKELSPGTHTISFSVGAPAVRLYARRGSKYETIKTFINMKNFSSTYEITENDCFTPGLSLAIASGLILSTVSKTISQTSIKVDYKIYVSGVVSSVVTFFGKTFIYTPQARDKLNIEGHYNSSTKQYKTTLKILRNGNVIKTYCSSVDLAF